MGLLNWEITSRVWKIDATCIYEQRFDVDESNLDYVEYYIYMISSWSVIPNVRLARTHRKQKADPVVHSHRSNPGRD
jgi:hypothetical protein